MELVEMTRLAKSIVIQRSYNRSPTAYLSNIPSRFYNAPYLQSFKNPNRIPNHAIFLYEPVIEPSLPLHLSILENNIHHVQMWIKHKPQWLTPAPFKLAAISGHLEIVKLLVHASKNVWTPEAMDLAAMNGYLEVVKWLHELEDGRGCSTMAKDSAATYGHLEVVKFLNEYRSEGCTPNALSGAVWNGYSKVTDYLLNNNKDQCSTMISRQHRIMACQVTGMHLLNISEELIITAIKANPLPVLQLVQQENIYAITKTAFDQLIATGDMLAIRYALETILTENNKPISILDSHNPIQLWTPLDNDLIDSYYVNRQSWKNSTAMDIAAGHGDLDTVILLHRSGIDCCTIKAMDYGWASAIGRLDILQWLHGHRTEGCSDDAMTFAAARGYLDVVKWLHELREMKCTKDVLSTAAYNGYIDVVSYLISIPMASEVEEHDGFFRGGRKHVYTSAGTPGIDLFCGNAVDEAAANGHISIVEVLSTQSRLQQWIKHQAMDISRW
ncbi:hypothetical protein THRCLA_03733 [Thraustotheca clavata]|uniref:Uncharacterized protein n=1 Tax=Thraustotheca clavata TaxID=74557 RepID=A0A1W0A150_9STRA|nr:hypothetical protein THRCLA_03733 [Thraustotheca clavata]